MSLSRQILVALVAGVAIGLFFGERVAFLEIGGRAFVQSLQVTVLPYVAGSLIAGFGSMKREDARLLASRGGLLLLALWALSLGLVFLLPLALPAGKGGAFFSFAGLEGERAIDWLDLYIPSNPFRSLANNVVPAVVVFAVLAGVGLMALPRKQALLEPLHVFNEAMGRVGSLLARLTPLGIFAIAGHTAGTMQLEALQRALPEAEVVPVTSIRDFVERKTPLDAMLTSWERACAWSLLHPELAPVATEPRPGVTALAYVLPRNEPDLRRVVDTWIGVVRGYERFASARQYWVLGQATRQKKPRWLVARDVLGWWKD